MTFSFFQKGYDGIGKSSIFNEYNTGLDLPDVIRRKLDQELRSGSFLKLRKVDGIYVLVNEDMTKNFSAASDRSDVIKSDVDPKFSHFTFPLSSTSCVKDYPDLLSPTTIKKLTNASDTSSLSDCAIDSAVWTELLR